MILKDFGDLLHLAIIRILKAGLFPLCNGGMNWVQASKWLALLPPQLAPPLQGAIFS